MIADPGLPIYTANGKGVTPELALASAFGEFMERLQCVHSMRTTRLGMMFSGPDFFHDTKPVQVAELWRETPGLMAELIESPSALSCDTLDCLPYWDVFAGRERLLPYRLMLLNCTSTGMAAGNTAGEALTQGICEVMERYPLRLLVQARVQAMPTIPLKQLPIGSPGMLAMLEDLRRAGLEIIVKDCTLDGKIPVLAVILIDHERDRFGLDYGCDPVFEIALERCITELYQGRRELPHRYSSWSKGRDLPLALFDNIHATLPYLLRDAPPAPFRKAFAPPGQSNHAYLAFLINRLKEMGHALYARDFSFLGFPSHHVIIGEMSAPRPLTTADCFFHFHETNELLSLIYRLSEERDENRDGLERIAEILAPRAVRGDIYSKSFEDQLSKSLMHAPLDDLWFPPRLFMSFLFIHTGRWEDALQLLRQAPQESADEKVIALCDLLGDYCSLKLEGVDISIISQLLEATHGLGHFGAQIKRLLAGEYASLYFRDPPEAEGRAWKGIPLPRCISLSACAGCPCRRFCYPKRFLELRGRLQKAYRPISQQEFGQSLQTILAEARVQCLPRKGLSNI
ncbi:hypothetical protein FAK_24080 [Desulfoferula mesophila]|uniref:YcaO domain-containing protein n=1 Tax=Desulfoferula mesophila TaxID=3058419 RepID=A0AAU9F3P0_9BACT|nr:hypothetical protein FAK_24080 [Desulfoferula mesophilus]